MVRGQPDFGIYTQTPVASGISDPGEAAARLGSINVYDRRGWTVWMDDFEHPDLKWAAINFGGGTLPILSTTLSWIGAQSLYFTIGAALNDLSQILRYFPLVRLGKIGIEFWIALNNGVNNYFRLQLNIRDGTNVSSAELRLDSATRTATIVTPLGNIVVATFCFPTLPLQLFIPVKLVVDMDTDQYVRLMIGSDEVDISAHSLMGIGLNTDKLLRVYLDLNNAGGGAGLAYLDNFILTQNEP